MPTPARSLMITIAFLIYCSLPNALASQVENPRLFVDQQVAFYHEPIAIRATGLAQGTKYTFQLRAIDADRQVWNAEAKYLADQDGVIDLGTSPAVAGDYLGIYPMGLFWSLRSDDTHQISTHGNIQCTLSLLEDGTVIDTLEIVRLSPRVLENAELEYRPIRDGFIADVYIPTKVDGKIPVIIYLGGSGGGFRQERSTLLANEGYAVVNLKYFRYEGLPDGIIEIPLEYVHRAYEWIEQQGIFDLDRVGVIGRSRGSELAMLYALKYPNVSFVIAEAPSNVVWFGWADGKSSWSYQNVPFPYAEYSDSVSIAVEEGFAKAGIQYHDGPKFASAFQDSVMIERCAIPVESLQCPILFISGEDDLTWPASMMAERMTNRLIESSFSYEFQHLDYRDAGHNFGGGRQGCGIPYLPPEDYSNSSAKGGTVKGNALAAIQSWHDELAFIARHFK